MLKLYVEYWDTEDREWRLSKMIWWKAIIAVLVNEDCSFAKVIRNKDTTFIQMKHQNIPSGKYEQAETPIFFVGAARTVFARRIFIIPHGTSFVKRFLRKKYFYFFS